MHTPDGRVNVIDSDELNEHESKEPVEETANDETAVDEPKNFPVIFSVHKAVEIWYTGFTDHIRNIKGALQYGYKNHHCQQAVRFGRAHHRKGRRG